MFLYLTRFQLFGQFTRIVIEKHAVNKTVQFVILKFKHVPVVLKSIVSSCLVLVFVTKH